MIKPRLDNINPAKIRRNPNNPRLIFREAELDALLNSISKMGIRVALSIYEDDVRDRYVLLDGERRWLCAKKLNLETVPAIIEPKPSKLENILKMFNIHNVRVQWDLYAIAIKLKEIGKILEKENKPCSIKDLATVTGVSQTTVKRAFELLELPPKYLELLRKELNKPKSEQKFTEDFFIEMMKALKSIEKYTPQIVEEIPKEKIMQKFLNKYKEKVFTNIVKFRDVSKMARSEKAGIPKSKVTPIIRKLINDPKYTIEKAYNESVSKAYEERTLKRSIESLTERLKNVDKKLRLSKKVKVKLKELDKVIRYILKLK